MSSVVLGSRSVSQTNAWWVLLVWTGKAGIGNLLESKTRTSSEAHLICWKPAMVASRFKASGKPSTWFPLERPSRRAWSGPGCFALLCSSVLWSLLLLLSLLASPPLSIVTQCSFKPLMNVRFSFKCCPETFCIFLPSFRELSIIFICPSSQHIFCQKHMKRITDSGYFIILML